MGADAVRDAVSLAVNDTNFFVVHTDGVRTDLRHHRLKALADRRAAGNEFDCAIGVDAGARPISGTAAAFIEEDGHAEADGFAFSTPVRDLSLQTLKVC